MQRPISTDSPVWIPEYYVTRTYLEAACAAVRLYGWQKKGTPKPTWEEAKRILDTHDPVVSEEDIQLAAEILDLMPSNQEDAYFQRLASLLQQRKLRSDELAMVASAVVAFQRWQRWQILFDAQTYLGKEDEFLVLENVERVGSHSFERDRDNGHYERVENWHGRGYHLEYVPHWIHETVWAHRLLTPENAIVVIFLDEPLEDRFYRLGGIVHKHRKDKRTDLQETIINVSWIHKLPLCNLCGKSTDPKNTTDEHCQCIGVDTESVLLFGEFDIEVEEL